MSSPELSRKNAPVGALVTPRKPDAYSACCPTRMVLDHVADKWTGLVLRLVTQGPWRFNALRREVEGISPKVLSGVLKRLERDGLVSRCAFATVPVTVEYSVTPLGRTLDEVLAPVVDWAEANIDAVLAAQAAHDVRAVEAWEGHSTQR